MSLQNRVSSFTLRQLQEQITSPVKSAASGTSRVLSLNIKWRITSWSLLAKLTVDLDYTRLKRFMLLSLASSSVLPLLQRAADTNRYMPSCQQHYTGSVAKSLLRIWRQVPHTEQKYPLIVSQKIPIHALQSHYHNVWHIILQSTSMFNKRFLL
jgi:hypothetical protein